MRSRLLVGKHDNGGHEQETCASRSPHPDPPMSAPIRVGRDPSRRSSSARRPARDNPVMMYRVLGSVEMLTAAGEPVAIGADRQSALLAALIARRGQVVSIDRLVDLLWHDDLPQQPANAVQVLVSRLRSAAKAHGLDFDDLQTKAPGYVLDADVSDIDAGVFEQLVGESAESELEGRIELLRQALSMWRGRAFGEYADVDIARLEAIRLDEVRRAAVVDLGAAMVGAQRPDEAVAILEPFIVEHPLDEGARAELMRGLYAQGRHVDALSVYQDYRGVLGDELGLEPSTALRQLEDDILQHEMPDGRPAAAKPDSSALASMVVRYLDTGDGAVAWAKVGVGPRLVVVPAWVTSLDVTASGRDPRSSLMDRLTSHAELLLYDRRGTGLSRGLVEDFSTGAASRELETVIEATGGSAALLAISQAGPTALTVAARRPDLVSSVILFGTFASGPETFGNPSLISAILDVVRSHWGVGSRMLAALYRPDASDAAAEHLGRVLRDSASREVAAGYLETVYSTDVTDLLSGLACPALVIHYRGDRVIPFSGGQQLAAAIPGAQFLALEGHYHLPDAQDLDRLVEAISRFLTS